MPYLSGITVYPFKSFDPVAVTHSRITEGGGLEHDREFALFDAQGKFVNGKRTPLVHRLSISVDWKDGAVCLQDRASPRCAVFHLRHELAPLEAWLSEYFAMPIFVRQNTLGGHPDDLLAPGPTVIGRATLEEVAAWYPGVSVQEFRVRFRANLEIAEAPPFWEDHLFADHETTVRFNIGNVLFDGTNPCQRCIVPTRDSRTGEQDGDFAQTFCARREAGLPSWADKTRFNHFYRLAVNTRIPATEIGKSLRVGDTIRLLGSSK